MRAIVKLVTCLMTICVVVLLLMNISLRVEILHKSDKTIVYAQLIEDDHGMLKCKEWRDKLSWDSMPATTATTKEIERAIK